MKAPIGSQTLVLSRAGFTCGSSMVACAGVRLLRDTIIDRRGMVLAAGAPYGLNINGLPFACAALVSLNEYQYSAYWAVSPSDGNAGHVAVARRKLADGKWEIIDLPESKFRNGLNGKTQLPWDAHNVVSLGLCVADGSLHLAYDHHNSTLRYRATRPGVALAPAKTDWTADLFGPEFASLVPGEAEVTGVTYPAFIDAPDGTMQMAFRRGLSGDGSWWLHDYDPTTHAWARGWQYDDGHTGTYVTHAGPCGQRCAYPNGWTYGSDAALHITYTYRENFSHGHTGNGSNHDVNYVYSMDRGRTWKISAGAVVSSLQSTSPTVPKRFTVESPGLVVERLRQTSSLMNQQTQAVDTADRIHTIMWHLDPAKADPSDKRVWQPDRSSYFHYWRDTDGAWKSNVLPGPVGNRPQLAFDRNDTAYVVYTIASGPDIHTKDIYFEHGRLVIATATAANRWADWTVHDAAPGPFGTEPLLDSRALRERGVLSVFIQDSCGPGLKPTPIHAVDFSMEP